MRKFVERLKQNVAAASIAALVAVVAGGGLLAAQGGFPFVYPFAGVQPQQSVDFGNPPITIGIQSGGTLTAAQNSASRGPYTPKTIDIGSVAYGSLGTATTYGASGTQYLTTIFVPFNMTVTNINFLNGGTTGTNAVYGVLYNNAGVPIGNSALAGATTGGANAFQALALTTPLAIQGPGRYYVGITANGATDNLRLVAANTYVGLQTSAATGTFGTVPNPITIPTTFSATQAPIVFLN